MNPWPLALAMIVAIYLLHLMLLRRRLRRQAVRLQQLEQTQAELEEKLARRQQRLDVLFAAVDEAVLRVDRKRRVLAANRRALELLQPQGEVRLPQPMLTFYRDPEWQRAFSRALARLPQPSLLPRMQVGGRVLMARLVPLGERQALLLCPDITQQARLEEQRQALLANLMHDLKTPLTTLLGYARSIQSFGDDPKLRFEAAQVIADEAKHVNRLLDEVLMLEQLEHGELTRQGSCRLTQVWQQVADALKPQWQEKSMQVCVDFPADMAPLAIEADDMRRLLTNIVENAVHHTPANTRIEVVAAGLGSTCRLEVRDDGPGIPAKHLPHVAERFYCVDRARSRGQGGHGLGLAIAAELLRQYGGHLSLENMEPHGLRVIMELPLAAAVHQAA